MTIKIEEPQLREQSTLPRSLRCKSQFHAKIIANASVAMVSEDQMCFYRVQKKERISIIPVSCIMDKAPGSAKIGEHGRISENPLWIMPPEALTQSSDVERWFIRMERYFRAADVPGNHRAATVQYHMDEAMGDVLSAMEVKETDNYDKLK
ncbi:hypothetical protein T02_6833 [Trichinella nativa]|uniref:Uncharacterized protein n=1 Tax=Trichinella nativa TaxID=6335 RepID=A0A0V1LHS2_9BILA|nr:hypothetical protein T02_6833 [Trichinella nativa]